MPVLDIEGYLHRLSPNMSLLRCGLFWVKDQGKLAEAGKAISSPHYPKIKYKIPLLLSQKKKSFYFSPGKLPHL